MSSRASTGLMQEEQRDRVEARHDVPKPNFLDVLPAGVDRLGRLFLVFG